jgi:RNA polymerase sigma-70 factor (ECF subfamily)
MARSDDDATAPLTASLLPLRRRFLSAVGALRPRLHRFCARMCGSVLDGEDLVQETLAQAFFQLPTLQDEARLEAWLFRIAHHKCIDWLRHERRQREETVPYDDERTAAPAAADEPDGEPIGGSLAALVGELPPRERAAVLLKDVLSYRLAEVAEVTDTTVGGVKAALHRGRAKLRALAAAPGLGALDGAERRLLDAYVACFNRRDWDALARLIAADARLEVVDVIEGRLGQTGGTYFSNYAALPCEWRLGLARVDGEPMVVQWRNRDGAWRAHAAVRLWWRDGKVVRIRDYVHVDYLLDGARVEALD